MADYKPAGWPTISVRIFTEDTTGLVGFLREVFDATGDYVEGRPAEMAIGDSMLMVSSGREAMGAFLYVYVPDVEATYRKAVAVGAKTVEAPTEMFYGDRRATVTDSWGNTWQIATRLAGASAG